METIINDSLKVESNISFLIVESFHFEWELNCHSILELKGYINCENEHKVEALYGSKIKIMQSTKDEWQLIFCGCIVQVTEKIVGNVKAIYCKAYSTTCMLDQIWSEKVFQRVEKTYADVIQEAIINSGGQVICTEGKNKKIERPLIQHDETVWNFSKRLISHLGNYLVADITNEIPSLWFGIRNGEYIQILMESKYNIYIKRILQNQHEISYEIECRDFYKIGDRTNVFGYELIICGVVAIFNHGELIYRYTLREVAKAKKVLYNELFAGMGFEGTITEVQGEKVKIALDIDQDVSGGDYFYEWYPETGNALYAMPEIGVKAILFIPNCDERDGFVVHCLPDVLVQTESSNDKYFINARNQSFHIFKESVSLYQGLKNNVLIEDGYVITNCIQGISILSKDIIRINAKMIMVQALAELNIYQG